MTRNNVTVNDSRMIVRLAVEGVPIAAISRVMMLTYIEVVAVLKEAALVGEIPALPPADWPLSSRKAQRSPVQSLAARAAVRLSDAERLVLPLQRAFGLSRLEARAVALLTAKGEVSKDTICALSSAKTPKSIEVAIWGARKKLRPYGIEVMTIPATGYAITPPNRDTLLAALRELEPQEIAA